MPDKTPGPDAPAVTEDTATADLILLRAAAETQLIEGFRASMAFLDHIETAFALDVSAARKELFSAFGRAIAYGAV